MKDDYDVIIVGAGMVGAVLATALSRQHTLRIALIEIQAPTTLKTDDKPDLRVSALTQTSQRLLTELGIWSLLMPERLSAFTDMEVWENKESLLHFDCAEIGAPLLGHIIENHHLQQKAIQACRQQANIDFICPAKPTAYAENELTLEDGRHLTARLIVAADGAQSPLREWAGIQTRGWAYNQTALVCTVTTKHPHQHTAWQKFLPEGPLAFLPLPDPHQCSIVWSQHHDSAAELTNCSEQTFITRLTEAFDARLGEITQVSKRASFPLKLRHADTYVKPGFALVGDAAHTIHPLAGQGVNIGLLDAAALAAVISNAHQQHRDIGSLHTLAKYHRRRRADNMAMQLTMDAFKRVFSNTIAPLRWARGLGLRTVNHSRVLKNLFMHQATGKRINLPLLPPSQR